MSRLPRVALLPEIRELAGSLAAAREGIHQARADAGEAAWAGLRAAWQADVDRTPAVLVADLVAEAWVVLGEEALARGAAQRCELALDLAEAAAEAGSGDPYLAACLSSARSRLHHSGGRHEQARAELDRVVRLAEALEDPELRAQAEAARAALVTALEPRLRRPPARRPGRHGACDSAPARSETTAPATVREGKAPTAKDECKEDANA